MKSCQHCKIQVGGDLKSCPLCQSKLYGEPEEPHFPVPKGLKRMPLALKIILFILLSGCAVFVALDLTYITPGSLHPSLPAIVWVVSILLFIRRFQKNPRNISRIVFWAMVLASTLTILTGLYFGFQEIGFDIIIPILCCIAITANFIFCLIKAGFTENALVYMLLNIVIGVCAYIIIYVQRGNPPLPWMICLLLSIISLIGLVIFKGRNLFSEIQKRLHM